MIWPPVCISYIGKFCLRIPEIKGGFSRNCFLSRNTLFHALFGAASQGKDAKSIDVDTHENMLIIRG